MNKKATLLCVGSAMSLLAIPATASAQSTGSLRLSTGVSYSSGDYGEVEDTEVIAIPMALTYRKSGFKFKVSMPYVWVDGPGSLLLTPEGGGDGSGQGRGRGRGRGGDSDNSGSGSFSSGSGSGELEVENELEDEVLADDDIVDEDGFAAVDQSRQGIGDVNISLGYSAHLGGGFYLEPEVKVKLPTASRAKRLGSGETDFVVSMDLVKELGDISIYGGLQRRFAGKPEGSTIRSTWGASAGFSLRAADGIAVGAGYSWQESAFEGRQASSDVSGWVSTRLNDRINLSLYAGTGLNDNSADLFAGAGLSFRF